MSQGCLTLALTLTLTRLVAVKVVPLPVDTKEGELQKELRSEI